MTYSNGMAYKVRMKSGKLTREKWVKNQVTLGQVVQDVDAKLFRVIGVIPVQDCAVGSTSLVVRNHGHEEDQ